MIYDIAKKIWNMELMLVIINNYGEKSGTYYLKHIGVSNYVNPYSCLKL